MPTINNDICIGNISGLEELNDKEASSLVGGASFIALDDDAGTSSPALEFSRQQQGFNLSALGNQIGSNLNNITDRFSVVDTIPGARYMVLLFDSEDQTGNPERFEFTGTGEDQTFTLERLGNKVSSARISQLS